MFQSLRSLTAEFVGTLLFVFLGAGSVVAFAAVGPSGAQVGALAIALTHGVALSIVVSMTMSISGGHINPAVTTGLWIADKICGKLALPYVSAQLLSALGGAATDQAVLPRRPVSLVLGGPTPLAGGVI